MRTPQIDTIVFDIGNVLIDWNPEYLYNKIFDDPEKMHWFLSVVCPFWWNEDQDAGFPIARAIQERIDLFPKFEKEIRMYYDRWEETLGGPVEQSVEILRALVNNPKYKVYALTNWSAELFPKALKLFDFLHWFDGIVVSGQEKTRKPFLDIYYILLERYDIDPSTAIFIDDRKSNVRSALEVGMLGIHYLGSEDCLKSLKSLGVDV